MLNISSWKGRFNDIDIKLIIGVLKRVLNTG